MLHDYCFIRHLCLCWLFCPAPIQYVYGNQTRVSKILHAVRDFSQPCIHSAIVAVIQNTCLRDDHLCRPNKTRNLLFNRNT